MGSGGGEEGISKGGESDRTSYGNCSSYFDVVMVLISSVVKGDRVLLPFRRGLIEGSRSVNLDLTFNTNPSNWKMYLPQYSKVVLHFVRKRRTGQK